MNKLIWRKHHYKLMEAINRTNIFGLFSDDFYDAIEKTCENIQANLIDEFKKIMNEHSHRLASGVKIVLYDDVLKDIHKL